ncbi:Transposase [Halanaeroarchaeum sp. HSR-CO]|uniref:helix-turn-helix domain-containing protein n=1 Tax=Halanaeroarchaeum sp. HSR-CO TaxID=2866382 RepID=UPI00217D8CB6|nr:helix-turn-helix domain-containing protein [Halanaeroarchaeum sp. HSR-CO]UWG46321.1 Transposase [Halanaeroarchaeum sp. HSR-CO]
METLAAISQSDLRDALDDIDGGRAATRLFAALAYENGVTQSELANWFDVERKTVYNWLTRLDAENLVESATDSDRPGRNRRLTDSQFAEFTEALHEPPENVGFDAAGWTPTLAQRFLREAYGVEYSIPSCRRLMKEAGLTYRPTDAIERDDVSKDRGELSVDRSKYWVPE